MQRTTTLVPPASRLVAGVLLLAVVTSACSAPPPSTAIGCGPASALVPYPTTPELTGAPIGPLLIRGPYPSGAKDATALGYVRGRPFKMIVLVAHNMDADVTLTGSRCSDGQALRFWMNKGGLGGIWMIGAGGTPVPDEVMASTGDLRAVLPKLDPLAGTTAYTGYMLFPTPGAYRIEGFADDRKVGEATIVVSEQPFPAGQ